MKKKIYKVLSLLLTLLIVFSAFVGVMSSVNAATSKTYLVKASGDDTKSGLNQANALKTIAGAITKANDAGLTTGDTVTVKLVGNTAVNWLDSGEALPSYDFELIITSNSTTIGTVGNGTAVALGGDTAFKSVKINFGSSYKYLVANGNSVTFGDGTSFIGQTAMSGFAVGSTEDNKAFSKDININNQLPISDFVLGSKPGVSPTFNGNVNVVYNAATGTPTFDFGGGSVTYNKALNIELKALASVAFANASNVAFGTNGYIQILNQNNVTINSSELAVNSDSLWVINNTLKSSGLISLTDTKGVYTVDTTGYESIKAVNAANPGQTVEPVGNTLTLPAGIWNITASKLAAQGTYYVKAGGAGDGSSENSPLSSISAAVEKAKTVGGFIAGDEVTVKVIGTEKVPFGAMPEHDFKLIVTSNTAAEATVGEGQYVTLGGETLFTNIKVYFGGDTSDTRYKNFQCNGKNVTFGDGCSFAGNPTESTFIIGTSSGSKVFDDDFTINSNIAIRNFYLGADWHSPVFNGNVNVIYNYGSQSPIFRLGSGSGNNIGSVTFNKAMNLNIKSAGTVSFRDPTYVNFGENGYFQIINSSAGKIIPNDVGLTTVPADKLWVLNNVSGKNTVLEFTDTKGKFAVKLDNAEHKLVAENAATSVKTIYDGQDGLEGFMVLEPGVYTISIDRDPEYKYYYVDSENGVAVTPGSRPTDVGTEAKPVKTYSDATRLIAADGLSEIDVATIYLPAGVVSEWGQSPAAMKCTLVVASDGEEQATVSTPYATRYNAVLTANTTILDNTYLRVAHEWDEFHFNEHNLIMKENSTLSAGKSYFWTLASGKKRVDDVYFEMKGTWNSKALYFYAPYHSHTSTGDFNIVWDNASSSLALNLGNEGPARDANTPNIYEGNINVTIKNAETFSLSKVGTGAEIKGSLNVIIDDSISLPYNTKVNFNEFEVEGGKWYVTNVAKDNEFVSFGSSKGQFVIKGNKTAYSRKGTAAVKTHTGGIVDLSSASGDYIISDNKKITPKVDNPDKMLYYRLGGGHKHIAQWCTLYDEVTYVYEYTIFSHAYNLTKPIVYDDNRHSVLSGNMDIKSDKLVGNFHKVVAEFTIPKGVNEAEGTLLFVGHSIPSHDEGLILNRTCYRKDDPTKTDLFRDGNKYHNGLDQITMNYEFWGKTFSGSRGGTGKVYWTDGYQELIVMDQDLSYSDYLIYLNNPQDGEWWDPKDLAKEEVFVTYAKAKGYFKDQDGKGVSGIKFLLKSDEASYKATTKSNGKFDFGTILTGFYDLYILNGEEQIETGFSSYISQDDVVEFNIVTDTSEIIPENMGNEGDFETDTPGEAVEEIQASGNLKGTVFTPQLEKVAGLKVILEGVGEAVTDENGTFGFADIPVGTYKLYGENKDGDKYLFREVKIDENVNLQVKLKYDPPVEANADETDNGWIIWVIIASVVALLVVGALVFFLVILKKKNVTPAE